MKRQAPFFLTAACLLISIALVPTDRTRSMAFSHPLGAGGADLLTDSQGREPQERQTGTSRGKSRSLVHKRIETKPPGLELNDVGPQSFAVIIGISTYKNLPLKSHLEFADEDASAIRDFLIGPSGGFSHENVELLLNEQASREPILRALERLQNKASPDDLAFIFFAGHGIVRSGQGFVLAYDSQPADLLFTAVEMDSFNSLIKNLRARSVVIFTDACHSGTIGDLASQTGATEPVTNLTAKAFADTSGRMDQTSFIFSAASPTQSSWELGSLKHGLFTHHVLEGLDGKADSNANGVVTADELYDHVLTNVRRDAEKLGRSQVPEFNPRYDRSIPLAYLNEAGLKLYREWFDSDPLTARYLALFGEALRNKNLIKPERESAWDYYDALKTNVLRTPPEVVNKMRDELLAKLTSSSQAVIDQSPSDPAAWQEASSWLEKAFDLSREKQLRARQDFCSAMSAHHSRENGKAEKYCDEALSTIKDGQLSEPLICFKIGQLYRTLHRLEKARDSYKLAIEVESRVEWVCEYAEVLKQLGDFAEADSQLRHAREKTPSDHRVLRLLAEVLLLQNRTEQFGEAVELAREARQLRRDDVDIEEVFGWALLKAGRPVEALEPLRKVAELRLSDERRRDDALLRLAQAYSHTGDLGRSVSALREAERRGSKLPNLYDELSQVLEQQGDLDGALSAGEKAATFVQSQQEKAKRVRRVAEYLERTGRISDAALKFRDAARLWSEVKVANSLDAHANVLSYRVQRFQDAAPVRKRTSPSRNTVRGGELLIIPAGRQPLATLTGVSIEPSGEAQALAVIFDSCLRDKEFQSRLVRFYEKYPELEKRFQRNGIGSIGILTLPAAGQTVTPAAVDVLAFFGVKDKAGRREVDKKEFESKRFILEALGGSSQSLERGERTQIKLNANDEFRIPLGMNQWTAWIKDMPKEQPLAYLLGFLKDHHAMRLYVGFSRMPENAAEDFAATVVNRENWNDSDLAVHFAAPFLRFTPEGRLYVPGQQQGEINWQRLLKVNSFLSTRRALLKKENAEAMYLFAALSNAHQVGDFIARSKLLDDLYRLMKDSSLPESREPFDLLDLLSFVRLEDDKLRLPRAVELWIAADRLPADRKVGDRKFADTEDADPIAATIRKVEKTKAGRAIPLARLIAALDQIERERPDWVTDLKSVELLVKQISSGREAQLELALDLQMSWQQVELYLSRIGRIDEISTPALKEMTACVFQSALELLRIVEKNGVVRRSTISDATNQLLDLDPSSEGFPFDVIVLLRTRLLGAASPLSGQQFEQQFIAVLGQVPPYLLQDQKAAASNEAPNSTNFYRFDAAKAAQERIARNLHTIRHTRLSTVINAAAGLDLLEKEPTNEAAIQQFRAALEEFIEPEPPPPPKNKSKQPVVRPLTMKEIGEQLTTPVGPNLFEDLRHKLKPFLAQALLGAVYAVMANPDQKQDPAYAGLVLNHDMTADAWGRADYDGSKKGVRGGVSRLGYALAILESRLGDSSAASSGKPAQAELFTASTLNSLQAVNHRLVTKRAAEFVSRSIDLGEDVLGLYLLDDLTARTVLDQLDQDLTPRRAHALRAWLAEAEIKKALISLSLSELYSIGQRYFSLRLDAEPIANLVGEPGALGAMANAVSASRQSESEKDVPEALRREIRQFGMTTTTRTGLMRLDLQPLEAYEQSLTVGETSRLVERLQDFKLAVVRACYRRGHTPMLAFSPALVRAALEQSLGEMGKGTGRIPPDRAWQDLLKALQVFDEASLTAFIEKLASSGYASPVVGANWNDETARTH